MRSVSVSVQITALVALVAASAAAQPPPARGGGGRGAAGPAVSAPPPQPARGASGPGPADKHVVDAAAADRGRKVYAAECITCHGTRARGNDTAGTNLIRSIVVLHDRYGNEIGPFLRKGHPTQSAASFSPAQIDELAHFVHQRVYETLRSSPTMRIQDVLSGDAKAGAAYFNGEGACRTCHSPTGDLARIGSRYDPPTLQQRFVFPPRPAGAAGGQRITVTVTPASGPAVSGVLVRMDDFTVSLRDASGEYRSWTRTPGLKIEKQDPYAAHVELLDRYTDKNIHDVVAYLETLK